MLFFLFSAFFMVSADEEITVTGFVEDDVLLPCNCSNLNLQKDFQWQLENGTEGETKGKRIFKYDRTSNFTDKQFKTFLDEDSSNCSILLKNITLDKQGKYSCRFHSGDQYKHPYVTLKVCGQNISQYSENTSSDGKVYHCDVTLDCYRKIDIKWTLDGRCLTNSSTNNIFITFNDTGHHLHSTLETTSTSGSEPKCEVNPACLSDLSSPTIHEPHQHPDPFLKTLCKVVPVVLILGFLLIWYRRHGPSHRSPSVQDVENNGSSLCSDTSTNSGQLQNETLLSSHH